MPSGMIKDLKFKSLLQKIEDLHPEVLSIKNIEVFSVLLYQIFASNPIFDGKRFDPDKLFKKSEFDQFIQIAKKYKNLLATYLIAVRADIVDNPIRFSGELLKLIGLKFSKHSRDQSGGKTDYFYQLDRDRFDFMMGIIDRRKALPVDDYIPTYWKAIHQRHGFTTPIYVRSLNDWGADDWEMLMDQDLEEIFNRRKGRKSNERWLDDLLNS